MFAFWAILLLVAYGCFHAGGLADQLDSVLGSDNHTFIEPFPILKTLKTSTLIALGVLAGLGYAAHRVLSKPKIADTLIDTETELTKVTWPNWGEAWQGTLAVVVMVLILFLFMTMVDLGLAQVMKTLMGVA
jgi:preprotein translocase SecE subunit